MKIRVQVAVGMALACVLTSPVFSMQTPTHIQPNLLPTCGDGGDTNPWGDLKHASPRGLSAKILTTKSSKVAGVGSAALVIGTTPEAIHKNFASVIEANFANGPTETLLGRLSDKELVALARHYQDVAGTQSTPLLKTLASRVSDEGMIRVARAFDQQAVRTAVINYAPASVRESFTNRMDVVQTPLLASDIRAGGISKMGTSPAPTVDMTLNEIYLDYRTAPVGSLSPAGALAETAMFAGGRLTAAAGVGYELGTQINGLIDEYDPDLGDAIGGTIDGTVTAYHDAVSEIEQGHYQSAWDDMFGFAITNSGNPSGDWDVSSPMEDYYESGGGCGW